MSSLQQHSCFPLDLMYNWGENCFYLFIYTLDFYSSIFLFLSHHHNSEPTPTCQYNAQNGTWLVLKEVLDSNFVPLLQTNTAAHLNL